MYIFYVYYMEFDYELRYVRQLQLAATYYEEKKTTVRPVVSKIHWIGQSTYLNLDCSASVATMVRSFVKVTPLPADCNEM
jgi:hypothetical protein